MIKWIFLALGFIGGYFLSLIISSLAINKDIKGTFCIDGSDIDSPRFRFVFDEDPDNWMKNRLIIFRVKQTSLKDISQN